MSLADIVRILPMFSALTWLAVAGLQLLRLRFRTWTERFFLAGLLLFFLYALNDWLFLNVSLGDDPRAGAIFIARLGMSYLTLVVLTFLFFIKAFHSQIKPHDLVFVVPTVGMLGLCWSGLVRGVEWGAWGWSAIFDPLLFGAWFAYALGYSVIILRYVYHISSTLMKENPQVGKKTRRLFILFTAMMVMGALSNSLFIILKLTVPPLFSSLLLFPAAALLFVLSPLTKDRIAVFIKRWKARAYEVRQAFLVYQNGTLIASVSKAEGTAVDQDIFTATLDAIQTFMRTSFPVLRGKWLKTIEHGDVKILLERGQTVYLAVIISGEENDELRRMMRDALNALEIQNSATLMDWSGIPDEVKGAKAALGTLFKREVVF